MEVYCIPGALSLAGGIFALRRTDWALALTGSIATFLTTLFLGIPAVVLTVLARPAFDRAA